MFQPQNAALFYSTSWALQVRNWTPIRSRCLQRKIILKEQTFSPCCLIVIYIYVYIWLFKTASVYEQACECVYNYNLYKIFWQDPNKKIPVGISRTEIGTKTQNNGLWTRSKFMLKTSKDSRIYNKHKSLPPGNYSHGAKWKQYWNKNYYEGVGHKNESIVESDIDRRNPPQRQTCT